MKVPFYKQKTDCTCGPATLQMVFEYFGRSAAQDELATELGTQEPAGTAHSAMIHGAKSAGFRCIAKSDSTLDEVREFLADEIPVIANFINPATERGHYAVIVHVSESHVTLNDPWNGAGYQIAINDFTERWRGGFNPERRWILVLTQ